MSVDQEMIRVICRKVGMSTEETESFERKFEKLARLTFSNETIYLQANTRENTSVREVILWRQYRPKQRLPANLYTSMHSRKNTQVIYISSANWKLGGKND